MNVSREITLNIPADEVWESLMDGSGWLGDDATIDPSPAGEVRCGERSGFVEEVEEPRRLAFWWSRPGEDASRVEVELEEDEHGATTVRVVESRPLALLDLRGVDAIVSAPGTPGPEMSAALALR